MHFRKKLQIFLLALVVFGSTIFSLIRYKALIDLEDLVESDAVVPNNQLMRVDRLSEQAQESDLLPMRQEDISLAEERVQNGYENPVHALDVDESDLFFPKLSSTPSTTTTELTECGPISVSSTRPPANISPFDYGYATTAALKARADINDGRAQSAYANRLLGNILRGPGYRESNLADHYRRSIELKTIRYYLISAIKNGEISAAATLPVTYYPNSPKKPDQISVFAWTQIYELMGGKFAPSATSPVIFSEISKKSKTTRVANLINAYNLWGRIKNTNRPYYWAERLEVGENVDKRNKDNTNGDCDSDAVIYKSLTDIDSISRADIITYHQGEDPYIAGITDLEAYTKVLEESDFLAFPNLVNQLAQDFKDIRFTFIISAKAGNRDALTALIKMHKNFKPEYDPIEALAWEIIALNLKVEGLTPSQPTDYLGINAEEVQARAAELAIQYQYLFSI